MRDRSIDVARGLLVLMMVYGHVLQFFGDAQLFPLVGTLIDDINLLVFPTFVFCFGCTAALSYLRRPFRDALPGMMKTLLRSLAAFWLSGIGYRVLRENKPFAAATVRRVLLLSDIPGWSEFLAAFAMYGLLLLAGFAAFRWLSVHPPCALAVAGLCLLLCRVPYARITPTQLALFIGGTDYSYFPVVQYMPYFLAGMVYIRGTRRTRLALLALAALFTASGRVYGALHGALPSRFPPHAAWIALPALGTAAILLLARGLCALPGAGPWRAAEGLRRALSHFGAGSLYYLLASNLVLFTLSGRGIAPQLARKGFFLWTLPIQSPQGALAWTAALLLALCFIARLAGRGAAPRAAMRARQPGEGMQSPVDQRIGG